MKTLTPRKLKISRVWIEHKVDEHPDLSYLGSFSSIQQEHSITVHVGGRSEVVRYFNPACAASKQEAQADLARMEAYNDGNWHMIGIIAKAEIISTNGIIQTLHSGGLWGVESDSGDYNIKSIESEELGQLRTELLALGIGERAIGYAFKKGNWKGLMKKSLLKKRPAKGWPKN